MGRYTDYAPVGNTCPMINEVISIMEGVSWNLEDEDEFDLSEKFKMACGIMEDIRKANELLREWGNDSYKDFMELEKERDELENKNSELSHEIERLRSDIKYYEKLEY